MQVPTPVPVVTKRCKSTTGQTHGDAGVELEFSECPILLFLSVLFVSTHHPAGHAIVSIRSHSPLNAPALTPAPPLALSHTHTTAPPPPVNPPTPATRA